MKRKSPGSGKRDATPWWERRPPTYWDEEGNPRPKYVLTFWFEWRADTAFWPANDAARERFGIGPIAPERLPLTPQTRERVCACSEWHDRSLNWDYPPDPGPWREEECARFNRAVKELHATCVGELGESYELIFAAPELHEDPDLDAYLRDPKGFRRA